MKSKRVVSATKCLKILNYISQIFFFDRCISPYKHDDSVRQLGNALYKREKITWNNLHRFVFTRGLAYLFCFTWRKRKYTKENTVAKLKGK
jgi:hypothetical protein